VSPRSGFAWPTHHEEAAVHPRRHQLTRAVGVEDTIAIDVASISALLGSFVDLHDGLSNELDNDTLARLASAPMDSRWP